MTGATAREAISKKPRSVRSALQNSQRGLQAKNPLSAKRAVESRRFELFFSRAIRVPVAQDCAAKNCVGVLCGVAKMAQLT